MLYPLLSEAIPDPTAKALGQLVLGLIALGQLFLIIDKIREGKSRKNGHGWVTKYEFRALAQKLEEFISKQAQEQPVTRAEFSSLLGRFDEFMKKRQRDMDDLTILVSSNRQSGQNCTATHWRVLYVEDDSNDRELFKRKLCARFNIDEAENLQRGFRMMENSKYDCVLLDLNLPDCHGLETLKKFKERCPKEAAVILTGNEEPGLQTMASQLGFDAMIYKSAELDSNEISRKLSAAILRKRL